MRLQIGLFVLLGLSVVGCTRPGETADVILTLSPSQKQTLTADKVEAVFVNVSGAGINPTIVWEWSGHDNCTGTACSPPTSITIPTPVPKGKDRLIQYLAAVATADGGLVFKYADSTLNLEKSEEIVTLSPTAIGSSSTMGEIYGRYLDNSTTGGPSGMVEGRFVPPNGRPPMLFTRIPIMSGWFRFFALDGDARFNYTLDGKPLFSNLNLDSPELNFGTTTLRAASFQLPTRYRRYPRWDSQTQTQIEVTEMDRAGRAVIGFFGPGVGANHKVCYENSVDLSIEDVYQSSSPDSDFMIYNGAVDSTDTSSVRPLSGGVAFDADSGSGSCVDSNDEFQNHLKFYHLGLRNGSDGLVAFRPPFRALESDWGMQYVIPAYDAAGSLTLNWKYLPGVTTGSQRIAGARLMARTWPQNSTGSFDEIYGDAGVRCSALEGMGFSKVGEDVLAQADQEEASVTLNNVTSGNDRQFVICPFTELNGQRRLLDAGLEVHFGGQYYDGGSGSTDPGSQNPPGTSNAPSITFGMPTEDVVTSGPVDIEVIYSDNTDESQIALGLQQIVTVTTGDASCMVTNVSMVSPYPRSRIVRLENCSGTGSVRIGVVAGTATSLTGESAPAAGPSGLFDVDNFGPQPPMNVTLAGVPAQLGSTPVITYDEPSDVGMAGVGSYLVKIVKASDNSIAMDWTYHNPGVSLAGLTLSYDTEYKVFVRAVDMLGNLGVFTNNGPVWRTPDPCPAGYLLVPALSGYTNSDFCVAKYEAKQATVAGSSLASSLPTGTPWVNINRASAKAACEANGTGYTLISNAEWQSVARNIELVGINWSSGVVGTGSLNRGHSDNAPNYGLAATSQDTDACSQTGQSCSATSWDTQRRTHKLSNGRIIWDFAGNVLEWVSDDNSTVYAPDSYWSQVTEPVRQSRFGPEGNYSNLLSPEYGGLGYAGTGPSAGGAILRGGNYGGQTSSGVFYTNLLETSSVVALHIGFRCVYHP